MLIVPKKDVQLIFRVDYRKRNQTTLKDSYYLLRMGSFIAFLDRESILSSLDAYSSYIHMNISIEDRRTTAFVTHLCTYQYICMPLVLTSAPRSFQRALEIYFTKYKWDICLVYLEDISIYQIQSKSTWNMSKTS